MFLILAMELFCDCLHLKVRSLEIFIVTADMERQIITKSLKMCSEAEFIKIKWMRSGVSWSIYFYNLSNQCQWLCGQDCSVVLLCALLASLDSYGLRESDDCKGFEHFMRQKYEYC